MSRNLARRLAAMTLLCGSVACYSNGDPVTPRPYLDQHHPGVVRVAVNGQPIRMVYAAQIVGDSLIGNAGDSSVVEHRPNTRVAIPLADIRFITVPSTAPVGSSLLLVAGLFGALFLALELSGGPYTMGGY